MAKSLLPSRRGPGRSAQRVKTGDAIRAMFAANPKGVTIGDCHRYYTALRLVDWQKEEIRKIMGSSADLEDKAAHVHPRSPSKQAAFITRKTKAIDKIMARKRAPNTVTYAGFSRFFHFLVQLGYIEHEMRSDQQGKKGRLRTAPNMRGADGNQIMTAFKAQQSGQKAIVQIEPPVMYVITDLGWSVQDWNNPRKDLV